MRQKAEKVLLEVAVRFSKGKGPSAGLRREGLVPGVVYKEGESAVSIQVSGRELHRALKSKAGENVLISLQFPEDSKKDLKGHAGLASGENVVLIKELQHHPVTHQVLHVDFNQISLTKQIIVSVPLSFVGEAIGVKQGSGVLEHMRWEMEVQCLPTEIPAEIPVQISGLELGQTLHIKEITLPEGVKAVTDLEQPVIACVEPRQEEVAAPAEEGAAAEPEVIKQKKPEEEAAAGAAEGKEKEKEKPKEKVEAKKG